MIEIVLLAVAFLSSALSQGALPLGLTPTLLQLNSGWARMPYNVTESSWVPNLYLLNTPVAVVFQFSDAFCPGERVSVFVNGTFFGNSTEVPIPPPATDCAPNLNSPAGTAAYPLVYSRLEAELPAGQHQIAFKLIQSNPTYPTGIMFTRAYIPFESECPCSN